MVTTLKSKRHFASLATLLYLSAPLVNAVYYWVEDSRGAYPPNADTVAIPIYSFAVSLLFLSPIYAASVWLATRSYQGGVSFFAFSKQSRLKSCFWSLLLGSIVLLDLYDAAGKAVRILPLDVAADLIWVYFLLCLRSSLVNVSREDQSINSAVEPA